MCILLACRGYFGTPRRPRRSNLTSHLKSVTSVILARPYGHLVSKYVAKSKNKCQSVDLPTTATAGKKKGNNASEIARLCLPSPAPCDNSISYCTNQPFLPCFMNIISYSFSFIRRHASERGVEDEWITRIGQTLVRSMASPSSLSALPPGVGMMNWIQKKDRLYPQCIMNLIYLASRDHKSLDKNSIVRKG